MTKTLNQLTEITALADDDLLLARDVSAVEDFKITLANLREATGVNQRTIYVGSVAELEALSLVEGVNVYLTQEGRAGEFVVKTGTPPSDPQKGIYIVLANGNYAQRIFNKGTVWAEWFGAKGDGAADDTAAIQAALYFSGDGNPLSSVFAEQAELTVKFGLGTFLITDTIHQPSHVKVEGSTQPNLNIERGWVVNSEDSCVVRADFASNLKSAWVISGYARNGFAGLTDSDFIDPYLTGAADSDYDAGNFTRAVKCAITDISFYTEDDVAVAVSFAAAPDIKVRIGAYGFLHNVCGYISFSADVEVYGLSHHSGIFMYSPNGLKLSGYVNRFSSLTTPLTVEATRPAGWQSSAVGSHTGAERFWTTGLYCAFTNGVTVNSLVTEGWQRAKMFWSSAGVTDVSPYIERIDETAYHVVSSSVVVTSPFLFSVPSLTRSGGGGSLKIEGYTFTADKITSVNDGFVDILVTAKSQSLVTSAEQYSSDVRFEFYDKESLKVYVDPVGGANGNAGLTMANAVADLNTAITRANQYKADETVLKENSSVGVTASVTAERELHVYPESGVATIQASASSGAIRAILLQGVDLRFSDLSINIPAATNQSFSGLFKPLGNCTVRMESCNVTADSSSAIFNAVADDSAFLKFLLKRGSIAADQLGASAFASEGNVVVVYQPAFDTALSGTLTWGGDFRVL